MSQMVVQHSLPNLAKTKARLDAEHARRKRNAALESWRQRLCPSDSLPRGPYFIGKQPGKPRQVLMDEAWMFMAAPSSSSSL